MILTNVRESLLHPPRLRLSVNLSHLPIGCTLRQDSLDMLFMVTDNFIFNTLILLFNLMFCVEYYYDIDFIDCADQEDVQKRNTILYESYRDLVWNKQLQAINTFMLN